MSILHLSCPILCRLPETGLSTADTYMQGKSCPEGSVFLLAAQPKKVTAMPWLLMRTVFFLVSDHSNVINSNYYNLKHFKNVKLSFTKYTCVS